MRIWVKQNPVSAKRLEKDTVARAILEVEPKLNISLEVRDDATAESRKQGLLRFQMNPQKDWGPKAKAKRELSEGEVETPKTATKKKNRRKKVNGSTIDSRYSVLPAVGKKYVVTVDTL